MRLFLFLFLSACFQKKCFACVRVRVIFFSFACNFASVIFLGRVCVCLIGAGRVFFVHVHTRLCQERAFYAELLVFRCL